MCHFWFVVAAMSGPPVLMPMPWPCQEKEKELPLLLSTANILEDLGVQWWIVSAFAYLTKLVHFDWSLKYFVDKLGSIWSMPGNQSWSHCFQLKMLLFMGLCDVLDVQSSRPHRRRSFYHINDLLICSLKLKVKLKQDPHSIDVSVL